MFIVLCRISLCKVRCLGFDAQPRQACTVAAAGLDSHLFALSEKPACVRSRMGIICVCRLDAASPFVVAVCRR